MAKVLQLADLQLAIMQVLWEREQATVGEVRDALQPQRQLAHTTVATMLNKMEAKGYVKHRTEGRKLVYRPAIAQEKVSHSMVGQLLNNLFGGDVTQLVSHLLGTSKVTPETIKSLKQLIREHEKELDGE